MKRFIKSFVLVLVLTAALAGCGGGPSSSSAPLTVFVTSATGTGDLHFWPDALAVSATGVAAGDAVCQARANAAHLPGIYKAWLSDSTTDAYCHIQGYTGTVGGFCNQGALPVAAGPWIRTDGYPFADRIDKLINNGQVFAPVRYDENITPVADLYFTGTLADGTRDGSSNCANWASNLGTDNAALGRTAGATNWWTEVTGQNCSVPARLLCFQTGIGGSLPAIAAPPLSKKVFVTSVTGAGDLHLWPEAGGIPGINGGDRICQTLAATSSIPNAGKFKAWLSDGSNDAKTRIISAGPWYRLDGVIVANKAALIAGASTALFTAISYTETGVYVKDTVYRVWSGTDDTGIRTASSTCNNWADNTISYTGRVGDTHTSDRWWTTFTDQKCDQVAALYCFEDN